MSEFELSRGVCFVWNFLCLSEDVTDMPRFKRQVLNLLDFEVYD
jgi:hypothetical protein